MFNPSVCSFLPLLLLIGPSASQSSTQTACQAIEQAMTGGIVSYQGQSAFEYEQDDYWNIGLKEQTPGCMVLPLSTDEVSAAVKALSQYPDVKFAVKSGGHDPNPGHATAIGGVVISLDWLNQTTYNSADQTAAVAPGGEWNDVIGAVAPYGRTVVGGRLGVVGVGGYMAMGGLSFLSAQYGLACDQVVEWEVVKPDGSIVSVNAEEQPDMAVALRGSGSEFGIITKFTATTYPIGEVWGGERVYTSLSSDKIWAALHDFIANGQKDPKAAIICTSNFAAGGVKVYNVFFFYDGPSPPKGAFGGFEDIHFDVDLTKKRTYPELLEFTSTGADSLPLRSAFRSITLPYVPSRPDWYSVIEDYWDNITTKYLHTTLLAESTIAVQPIPHVVGENTAARGGNAMGLTEGDGDRFVLEINQLWHDGDDDDMIWQMAQELTDWLYEDQLPQIMAEGDVEQYIPLFMNDAHFSQDVVGSYRVADNIRALQKEWDPTGWWSQQAGGFKVQEAQAKLNGQTAIGPPAPTAAV